MLADHGLRVSSSRIRQALAEADLKEAVRLLQRPYRFQGLVVRGRGLGRGLGWPTANLQVDGRKCLPKEGVYAALVQRSDGKKLAAVMNLGRQPTIDPQAPSAVEVQLEGETLTVEPRQWLRGQCTFASLAELSAQIAKDAAAAAEFLISDC